MNIGDNYMQRCLFCEKEIELPCNPMTIGNICEEQGWKERLVGEYPTAYYQIFCPEHKDSDISMIKDGFYF